MVPAEVCAAMASSLHRDRLASAALSTSHVSRLDFRRHPDTHALLNVSAMTFNYGSCRS
jgi:hypothetical protein